MGPVVLEGLDLLAEQSELHRLRDETVRACTVRRGHIVLEINRHPVRTIDDFRRLTSSARPGDVLAVYLYIPEIQQRRLSTVRIDER